MPATPPQAPPRRPRQRRCDPAAPGPPRWQAGAILRAGRPQNRPTRRRPATPVLPLAAVTLPASGHHSNIDNPDAFNATLTSGAMGINFGGSGLPIEGGLRHSPTCCPGLVDLYQVIRESELADTATTSRSKTTIFNLLPPAMVALVVLFWAYAPKAFVDNEWSVAIVSVVVVWTILGLEWVHERHAGWRLNKQEFLTDLFYMILSATAISWVSSTLADDPLAAAKTALGISTAWVMQMPYLAQVAMVIVVFEFGQYWMHRLMHNNALFWSTHAPHHHITQLNAMKGYVGNPIELFLISLSVLALFDVPKAAIFAAFGVLNVVSTFAHANVRSDPPIWYSYFFTTIRNHSLHHTALSYEDTRCNYGNSLILLDRIFGTYREGESTVVGQGERKRLSIKEQFLFPFQPAIEAFKARRAASSAAN
jgi:sterol desaturase/sphingolipid hydroxylase (fatty acid hydroxylase superfamily)